MIAKELGVECPEVEVDLSEQDAFDLGVSLNIARRQLSPEQEEELTKRRDEILLKLRLEGKTQEEVAKLLEITRQAVSKREKGVKNTNNATGCAICIPNLYVKIPKVEHARIAARARAGEKHEQIAADYKTTRQRIYT